MVRYGNAIMTIGLAKLYNVRVILDLVNVIARRRTGYLLHDGTIVCDLECITGSTNEMYFNRLSAR
mgnify:CR=1 FL=1